MDYRNEHIKVYLRDIGKLEHALECVEELKKRKYEISILQDKV